MFYRTLRGRACGLMTIFLLVSALVAAVVYAREPLVGTGEAAVPPQELTRIESRLSQLEQRLYGIEVSIRGLEQQQSRMSGLSTGRMERDTEVTLLRSEVETLQRRLAEVECGLLRVDERTLSAAARDARRKIETGAGDPCRLNPNAPLRLSARP